MLTYTVVSQVSAHGHLHNNNSWFLAAWALTQGQNSICLYRSCYSVPLKCGSWALTREWALAQDTTVIFSIIIVMEIATKGEDNLYYHLHRSSQQFPVSRSSRHVEGSRIAKQLAPYMYGLHVHTWHCTCTQSKVCTTNPKPIKVVTSLPRQT